MALADSLRFRGAVQDARYAWRQLRRSPAFLVAAVLTLALGVGGAVTCASLARALAFAPLPVANLDRVFALTGYGRRDGEITSDLPSYLDLVQVERTEESSAACIAGIAVDAGGWRATVDTPTASEHVSVNAITGQYARVLGVRAVTGRWIVPADNLSGAAPVAVISERLWRLWFRADPGIAGHATVRVNTKPFTVVGVAPAEFKGLRTNTVQPDVWVPRGITRAMFTDLPAAGLTLVKARSGAPPAQCADELRRFSRGDLRSTFWLRPAEEALRDSRTTASGWMALSLSVLVWFAACANLANLLYARGTDRAGETAVRLSLGASPARVLRLFVLEALIIAALAAVTAIGFAAGATRLFMLAVPELADSRAATLALTSDARLFALACGASALAALVVGLATSRRASRVSALQALAASGAHAGTTRRGGARRTALAAVQITVAVMLVMGAGLYVERFRQVQRTGAAADRDRFDGSRLATARIDLELVGYNVPRGLAFVDELLRDVRRLPGVEQAAVARELPTSQPGASWIQAWDARPDEVRGRGIGRRRPFKAVVPLSVTSTFFETIGLPVRRSAGFSTWDTADGPLVAVVSRSAGEALWPGQDPLGRQLEIPHPRRAEARFDFDIITVVGVSDDPVTRSATSPAWAASVLFRPHAATWGDAQQPPVLVVIRAPQPAAQIEPLRQAIRRLDRDVATVAASSRDDYQRAAFGVTRALDALMAALGVLSFVVATMGVYGVIAYFVSTRTREFGIRLALGATPGRVVKLVVDYAVHIVLIGLLPGVFVVSVASRLIQSHVLDLMPNDLVTWIVVPLLIVAAGVLAGYMPARRAGRVDPNVALRDL